MWEQVKMPNRHFLRSDIFTVAMVYYFYFLCFGFTWNKFNSLCGGIRGRNQKTTACSEDIAYRREKWNNIRISATFCPLPHIFPKDYWIHSFWSQNTEKRNNVISQMRLSVLNTATTEQMGYDIISFFVCFLSNELKVQSFYQKDKVLYWWR